MNLDYNKEEKGNVPLGRPAKEIYKVVKKIKLRNERKSAELLRDICVSAVTGMLKKGQLDTEVEITEELLDGVSTIVDEMRALGYRHCLIETQNEEGDVLEHRLRISLAHFGE